MILLTPAHVRDSNHGIGFRIEVLGSRIMLPPSVQVQDLVGTCAMHYS
jgi:hypothetical protein